MKVEIEMKIRRRGDNATGVVTALVDINSDGAVVDHDTAVIEWDDKKECLHEITSGEEERLIELAYDALAHF